MGWEELQAVFVDQRADIEEDRRRPPERCPLDGALLQERDGIYHCPLGNWMWRS